VNSNGAFFNATFWPSVVLRTAVAVALGGLYALATGSLVTDWELRQRVIRYSSLWVRPAAALIPLAGLWFFFVAPARARELPIGGSAVIQIFVILALLFSLIIFAFTYLGAFRDARRFGLAMALLLLSMGFLVTGTGEWVREAVRKPYVISDYMYSNSILAEDAARLDSEGVLANARWSRVKTIEAGNEEEAGREVFRLVCSSCHTVSGYNAVRPLLRDWSEPYIDFQLQNLDELTDVMPPFIGTDEERVALAKWLAGLN